LVSKRNKVNDQLALKLEADFTSLSNFFASYAASLPPDTFGDNSLGNITLTTLTVVKVSYDFPIIA
jgi:hypothetical protein